MGVVLAVAILLNPQSGFGGIAAPSSTYAVSSIEFLLEPLAIVVNRANPIDGLSSSELREIFLGERLRWANGRRVTTVMRESGQPERNAVLHYVCRTTEKEYTLHYIHGLYTGTIDVSKDSSVIHGRTQVHSECTGIYRILASFRSG